MESMAEDIFQEFDKFDFGNNSDFQSGWAAIANILDPAKVGVEYLRAKIFFFSKHYKPVDLQRYLVWKKRKSTSCDTSKEKSDNCCFSKIAGGEGLQSASDAVAGKGDHSLSTKTGPEISSCEANVTNDSTTDRKEVTKTAANCDITSCDNLSEMLLSTCLDGKGDSERKTDLMEENSCENNKCVKQSESSEDGNNDKTGNNDIGNEVDSDEDHAEGGPSLSLLEIANHIQNDIPIPGLVKLDVQPTNLDPTPSNCERRLKPWEVTQT